MPHIGCFHNAPNDLDLITPDMRNEKFNPNTFVTSQKGFYGRARIISYQSPFRSEIYLLQSYKTIVMGYDGVFHRFWDGWSGTTMRHITSFMAETAGVHTARWFSKRNWLDMPIENVADYLGDTRLVGTFNYM